MPELPEVSIIVNQLDKRLKGLVLESIETDWPKKFYWAAGLERPLARRGKYSVKDLRGAEVVGVRRRGKVVIIKVQKSQRVKEPKGSKDLAILIHLKLTGQLIYQDGRTRVAGGHPIPPLNLPVPNKTTRVIFTFTGGGHLYFNDMRKFGWVRIIESGKLKMEKVLEKLGPDALEVSFEDFYKRLKAKGKSRIKKLLMDQEFISGVGNIYSDESLWRAKIHPKRLAGSLSDREIKALFEGLRESLKLAIEKGGSSSSAYVDSGGEKGLYLSFAKAYHMTGKPCERCGGLIAREKIDGRSAHFCPVCQKI